MTQLGIDCSQDCTPHIPALVAYGVEFVCRYVSYDGNPKNITEAEASALVAAGLEPKLVFETTEQRALSGAAGGLADAQAALAQAEAAGLPNVIIYMAVDYDSLDSQAPTILAYLAAANAAIQNPVGVYGDYDICEHALDRAIVTEAWQTYAWSAGQLSRRAQIWQVLNGQTIDGLSCDVNIGRF